MSAQTEWWKSFFSGLWLDAQRQAKTEEQTRAEADFIEKLLQLTPQAKVLDVPCGEGRLSLELASRGYHVTGVDITQSFLDDAQRKAIERQLEIVGEHRDMAAQNFVKLNKASSLVVNGHHRVPPHPTAWPPSNPVGVRTAGLPTTPLRFSTSLAESSEVQNLNGMVAHEVAGHWPASPKTFRSLSTSFFRGSTFTSEPHSDNRPKPNCQRTDVDDL